MKFFPFHKFQLECNNSTDAFLEKLSQETDKKNIFRNGNSSKKFEGEIDLIQNKFKINRILNYRNSFYPIIFGKVVSEGDKTSKIEIQMRMTIYAIVFMIVWSIITGIFTCLALKEQLSNTNFDYEPVLTSFCFFAFGYVLMIVCFNYEVRQAKKILKDLV